MRSTPSLSLFLLILILSLQIINILSTSCSQYLGPTSQTASCGSLLSYPSSSLAIPSPYKKLAISFSINPLSFCSGATAGVFLSVSIIPPGTTTRKNVMKIAYDTVANEIKFTTEDNNGAQDILTANYAVTMTDLMNKAITFSIAVDLTHTSPVGGASILAMGAFQTSSSLLTSASYGSDWVFNPSTLISICSDYDGTGAANCAIENFKVMYKFPTSFFEMPFSNQVNVIGDYQLKEGTGLTLANSPGKALGSATISATGPIWNSNNGLVFDGTPTQYIEITGFTVAGQDSSITSSFGIAFYLKIDPIVGTDQPIFSFESDFYASELFHLHVTPSMTLKTRMDYSSVQTTATITPGAWNTIYVVYAFTASGYGISKIYINGVDTNVEATVSSAPGPTIWTPADKIKIGQGFPGELRHFQVYSPAAFGLATGNHLCDSSSCSVEMGFSNPPVCQQAVCSVSGYPSFDTCKACDDGNCKVCENPQTCKICNSRFVEISGSCQACPAHCISCIDHITCKVCDSGYGLVNGACILCPAGTYLTNNQECKKFSETLQDTLDTTQTINSGATQMSNAISQGSSISLSAAISGKIFSQIKFLNISYSGELQVALLTWLPSFVSLGLTPDMSGSMIAKIPERPVPYVFEKYDVPSSFLRNFWENLGIVVFVTALWLISKGIENYVSPKNNPRISPLIRKARVMIQNFLMTALYGVYGDLVLYSLIEYRTISFGWNLSLFSFLVSIILLVTMFITFWYQTKILLDYQRIKKQGEGNLEKFTKSHEGSQVLFKDFKDYSLSPQLFLFFLSGRDLLFSLILATMFEYPLPQIILSTIFSCLMIVYLLIKKPFESAFDFTQQLFFEIVGLMVNGAVLVNAVLDAGKYETIQARQNIGKLIIVANIAFNFVTAIFMLISIVQILREVYQNYKQKQAKKLKALSVQNRLQLPFPNNNFAKNESVNLDSSVAMQNLSSNNNLETVSFNQESFDLSLLPHHIQLIPNSQNNRKKLSDQLKKSQDPLENQEFNMGPNSSLRANKSQRYKKSTPKAPFPLPQINNLSPGSKMPKRKLEADITLDFSSVKSQPKK